MKVTLVAKTDLIRPQHIPWSPDDTDKDADALTEMAGRLCYLSWSRPNPSTATNPGYLKHILEVGHESVLEHASVSFLIEGVSRSLTHELIRHRHLSFSQLSQRYVDESESKMVDPPVIDDCWDRSQVALWEAKQAALKAYSTLVWDLEQHGVTGKQAREAARAVLPNATETKILATGNLRAWRDVLKKRWHVAADAEIRALAGELLAQLRTVAPNSFQDIPEEPYDYG